MKVIALSDIHGYLPEITEKFDLMLICGDVCPVDQPHTYPVQEEWIMNDFIDWLNQLPYRDEFSRVVFCAGNHDFYFEKDYYAGAKIKAQTNGRVIYLDNEEYTFENMDKEYKIFGCPYCKPFGLWAFMREDMEKYYSFIPEGLDILICHDAPDINGLGMIKEGRWKGENAGNPVLAKRIMDVKPKYCFNGHIHSGTHEMFTEGETNFVNVSIMNEHYVPENKPLIIDII